MNPQCTLYSSSEIIFCGFYTQIIQKLYILCFYLYNVHIKECTFDVTCGSDTFQYVTRLLFDLISYFLLCFNITFKSDVGTFKCDQLLFKHGQCAPNPKDDAVMSDHRDYYCQPYFISPCFVNILVCKIKNNNILNILK